MARGLIELASGARGLIYCARDAFAVGRVSDFSLSKWDGKSSSALRLCLMDGIINSGDLPAAGTPKQDGNISVL